MRILISGDHAAPELIKFLKETMKEEGFDFILTPAAEKLYNGESVDYPDMAEEFCDLFKAEEDKYDFGMLICGTGIGISMAANRIKGIRAANVLNEISARYARRHNDANVLCLGARIVGQELAMSIVRAFAEEKFEGGRHERRVKKIEALSDK